MFKPYSGVKTRILLLDKKTRAADEGNSLPQITADGFDLGDKRNPIEANDLLEAERVVKAWLKGQIGGANGPTISQPGARPQVSDHKQTKG